jgi:hypothetical protein
LSAFSEFLRRVKIKSVKFGPVTWDILPPEKIPLPARTQEKPVLPPPAMESKKAPPADMRLLNDLIGSLENFHSNPEGIYYIGQTLVRCDSFLMDNGIVGEPIELCEALIHEMDNDSRVEEGLFDPRISVGKINSLKRSLKKFRDDILRYENEA